MAGSVRIPDPPKERKPEGFTGDTWVLTDRTFEQLRGVGKGRRLVNHEGDLGTVADVEVRKGQTVRVVGHGHHGIRSSDGHPLLARTKSGDPEWKGAIGVGRGNHTWATPTRIKALPVPPGGPTDEQGWWLLGQHLRGEKIRPDGVSEGWIREHFGDSPSKMTVPTWAMSEGLPLAHRKALLFGYVGPDWNPPPTRSMPLAMGMRMIAESEGIDNRVDIEPTWAPLQTYRMTRLPDGHGPQGGHSWHAVHRTPKGRKEQLYDLKGTTFCINGMSSCGYGKEDPPQPQQRSRAQAQPPAKGGGGGGSRSGSQHRGVGSRARDVVRDAASGIVDTLPSSVPVIGGRKPRPVTRDEAGLAELTPAQQQRVRQGIRSLEGARERVAEPARQASKTSVPDSARAREAARRAEDRLNRDGVSVEQLAEWRQIDTLNGHIPGTTASSIAQQRGLVQQDVHDVLREERATQPNPLTHWDDAQTINQLGAITADRFLPGHLAHPNGHTQPDAETELIAPYLARLNNAGLATIGSQPGMANSVGYHGDVFHQNAAVQGFADPETADRIRAAAEAEGMTVIQNSGAGRRTDMSTADPQSGFGAHLSQRDVDNEFGGRMADTLRNAEQITLVDPEVGRNDRLAAVAERLDQQRRSDPVNDAWRVDALNGLPEGTTEADMRRSRGETVPDLRDELRTPAEREERAARMAAAEQAHAQDHEQAGPARHADRVMPLDAAQDAFGETGFDKFARAAEERGMAPTPEPHTGQPVAARVDGQPVAAEIVDMAGMVGERQGLPTADRARIAPPEERLTVDQIAAASRERDAQAVDWDALQAAMAGRAPMPKDQRELVGAPSGGTLATAEVGRTQPVTSTTPSSGRMAMERSEGSPQPTGVEPDGQFAEPRGRTTSTTDAIGASNGMSAEAARLHALGRPDFYQQAEARAEAMRHHLEQMTPEQRAASAPQAVARYQDSLRDDWERTVGPGIDMPRIPHSLLGDLAEHLPAHPTPRIDPDTIAARTEPSRVSMQEAAQNEWSQIVAKHQATANAARAAGYPEERISETLGRNLDDAWRSGGFGIRSGVDRPTDGDQIQWPQPKPFEPPASRDEREGRAEGWRDEPIVVPATNHDLRGTGHQRDVEPAATREPDRTPQAEEPERTPQNRAQDRPEDARQSPREAAEAKPDATEDAAQARGHANDHDPEALERHGLSDLLRPEEDRQSPIDHEREVAREEAERAAERAAQEQRTREADRAAERAEERETERVAADEANKADREEREEREGRTPEPEPEEPKPDRDAAREAENHEREAKPTDPEPEPAEKPEPAHEEKPEPPQAEPDPEPPQWHKDAHEALQPSEPSHAAEPSHAVEVEAPSMSADPA